MRYALASALVLAALAGCGTSTKEEYRRDPSLRSLIDVVPFGVDPEPPVPGQAIKGVVPGIDASSVCISSTVIAGANTTRICGALPICGAGELSVAWVVNVALSPGAMDCGSD